MKTSRLFGAIPTCVFACLFMCLNQANAATINDFTGGYDVSNWTTTILIGDGSVDTTSAPTSVALTSANNNCVNCYTRFTIAALGTGTVSFTWNYQTTDSSPEYDPFGYLLLGAPNPLTNPSGPNTQSGTTSFAVTQGQEFGFYAFTQDGLFGAATTIVSSFSAPATIPVPAAFWLFGSGLLGLVGIARRKKA